MEGTSSVPTENHGAAPHSFTVIQMHRRGVWHRLVGIGTGCQSRSVTPVTVVARRTFYRLPHARARGVCRSCFQLGYCQCDVPLLPMDGLCSRCECPLQPNTSFGPARRQYQPGRAIREYHGSGAPHDV